LSLSYFFASAPNPATLNITKTPYQVKYTPTPISTDQENFKFAGKAASAKPLPLHTNTLVWGFICPNTIQIGVGVNYRTFVFRAFSAAIFHRN
jgi:hypothetical protein